MFHHPCLQEVACSTDGEREGLAGEASHVESAHLAMIVPASTTLDAMVLQRWSGNETAASLAAPWAIIMNIIILYHNYAHIRMKADSFPDHAAGNQLGYKCRSIMYSQSNRITFISAILKHSATCSSTSI